MFLSNESQNVNRLSALIKDLTEKIKNLQTELGSQKDQSKVLEDRIGQLQSNAQAAVERAVTAEGSLQVNHPTSINSNTPEMQGRCGQGAAKGTAGRWSLDGIQIEIRWRYCSSNFQGLREHQGSKIFCGVIEFPRLFV